MRVGSIGLGIMGKPAGRNLLKAGYELVTFDFNKDAVNEAIGCGTITAANGKEIAEQCEVVTTIVPNFLHTYVAVPGENGVAESTKSGTVVTDVSSIDPAESKAIDAELAKLRIGMLDAPVFDGEPKAINDIPSIMVGDKEEFFDRYYNMLMVMADSVVYVDELGSGNVAKLTGQIVVAVNITIVSEALTFAKRAGTDPELAYQAIKGGLAGSTVMDAKAPMMLSRSFKPDFRVELHIKNLNNASNAAHAISPPVPLTGQLMEIMQGLRADGYKKEDHSSTVKYHEKIANTTVES